MKYIFTLLLSVLFIASVSAQEKYSEDVQTIDSIIEALYASISGEKGLGSL
ncbi:MAG: hypothetical protein ABJR05_14770 [Balneola sp.]